MSNFVIPTILALLNYLAGSISSAKIIARSRKNIDISKVGFKTAGGSNIAESIGLKWGILVGAFDILKGIPILVLAKFLQVDADWLSIIALSAIVGHCWPIWFKLKGGRGLASFFGTGAILFPSIIIFPLIFFILTIPFWYLRKQKRFNFPLLSSPTFTLTGLIVFVLFALNNTGTADNIFAISALIIVLLRRVTARPSEYPTYNPFKLFLSRLIFDNSDIIK